MWCAVSGDQVDTQSRNIDFPVRGPFAECRDTMRGQVGFRLDTGLDRIAETMRHDVVSAPDAESAESLRQMLVALQSSRVRLRDEFVRQLLLRIDRQVPTELRARTDRSAHALSLQSEAVVDEYVAARSLVQTIDSDALDELPLFHLRLTKLLGASSMRLHENPFAAPAIVGALDDALVSISEISLDLRTNVLRRLSSVGSMGFRTLYAQLNAVLATAGVADSTSLPQPAEARDTETAAPSPISNAIAPNSSQVAPPLESLTDSLTLLVSRLQHVLPKVNASTVTPSTSDWPTLNGSGHARAVDPIRGALGLTSGRDAAPDNRLLARLSDVQAQIALATEALPDYVTPPLRDAVPGYADGAVSAIDATTIELVAMLFDFVFARRELADEIKGILGRLQIPMLKAAMVDRRFFLRRDHPARNLLNHLADASVGWRRTDEQAEVFLQRLQDLVSDIVRNFTDDLSVFVSARSEFDSWVAVLEADHAQQQVASEREAEAADRLAQCAAAMRQRLDERVTGFALPADARDFVYGVWQPVLAHTAAEFGEDSAEVDDGLGTLDELIWSVLPKDDAQSRALLTQRLPPLVRHLRERTVAVSSAEVAGMWLDRLFGIHAGLLRGATPEYVPMLMEVVAEQTEDRPYLAVMEQLQRGQWVEFDDSVVDDVDAGALTYARLTWISPRRTTYLFTTRSVGRARIVSSADLLQRLRNGSARLLDAEPIVDQALKAMFGTDATQLELASKQVPAVATVA
ncbi:MAG: DUF1631 family protein [Burkholderiales bacterium]|nr:DUF1631 family protein [Burkholderiales bacterium]